MQLEYFGHSFWKITCGDLKIVIDPFDNIGYPIPHNLEADYVIISHEHHDHNNVSIINGNPIIIRTSGMYEYPGFRANLISVFHDDKAGAKRGTNNIIQLLIEDMILVHCGDLGHIPNQGILSSLDKADILLVPVGGIYTLPVDETWTLIKEVKPHIVIPMHYKTPALAFELGSLDAFLKDAVNIEMNGRNTININKDNLPESKVIVMNWEKQDDIK